MPSISGLYFLRGSFGITQFTEDKSLQQSPACPHINIYPTPHTFPDIFLQLDQPQFDPIETASPIAIPEAQTYAYFNKYRKQEFRFCKETAHAHGLLFLAFENVFPRPKPEEFRVCSEIAYAAQEKKLSIDEIRKLVMQLKDRHLSFYIREKWIPNHVNIQRRKGNESLDEAINAQKYISMRISFWDQYIDRIRPPHIAEVHMYGTKVRYYTADDLQRLQLVLEEDMPPHEIEVAVPEDLLKKKEEYVFLVLKLINMLNRPMKQTLVKNLMVI